MTFCCAMSARAGRVSSLRWFATMILLTLVASPAPAQSLPRVVRVEEDWEMVVGTPNPETDGPQVSCVMSPSGNLDSHYLVLDLNHRGLPEYAPGGLQLQVWEGSVAVANHKFPDDNVMATEGETVRWTQSVRLDGQSLIFEILNGHSTTWGCFGGQGYLRSSVSTALGNLNSYSPDVSVANSGVGYAGNRVQSLVLRRIRLTTSTGVTLEDDSPRVVHELP